MATRWGILSAGKISHDFVTCLRSIEDHEVKVVAARNVVGAKKFAELHNIPTVLDNYDDMAKQDVDVVYCGSLNTQHYSLVKHLLLNGKPVLCEKPLTMTYEQTEELVQIAREKKVFLMEAIWSRFVPIYEKVREELSAVGTVEQIDVSFGLKEIQNSDRVVNPDLGGSAMLDIGVYAVHFAQMVFGDVYPSEIKAVGELSSSSVDLQGAICLKYPNGKIASLTLSLVTDLSCEAKIYGSKGTIKVFKPFWCSEGVEINDVYTEIPFPTTVVECNYTNSSGLRYEAMHVRECLLQGLTESPILPLEATLKISKIMHTCMDQIGVKIKV